MWAQPQTAKHISGTPSTPAESWARLTRFVGMWSLLGFSYWYVEEKASNAFVGEVGFGDFKRDITPDIHGLPEIGWVLSPDMGGKGYATEAARAALAWGDENFGDTPTVCIIKADNFPSIRVAEKCGFKRKAETLFNGAPTLLFERVR
tara:strand:+ start:1061 stop:1504 length:444 start_codon:yes stop_codon:yes gene_type:complete